METADQLSTLFREQGLRVTPQRQVIFRLLVGNDGHPTVESLYDAARSEMPTISLKTVYQTVHDLESMGQVSLLDLGTGSVRVDPNVEDSHHHLICDRCGKVRDLPVDFPALTVPPRLRRGFAVSAVEVNFRGLCDDCASETRSVTP
jgi:Fe2+ or Zn2+ uptake regulation protein